MVTTKKKPKLIVAGLAQKGDKYLLIKEKLEDGKDYWLVPGGSVEFGESLETAIKREIKEEVGLEIQIDRFLAFKEAVFPDYNYHTVVFFYLVTPENDEIKITEEKILDGKFFNIDEIKDLKLVDSAEWLFQTLGLL